MTGRFSGARVLITGAAGGIGAAAARAFHDEGAVVIISDQNAPDPGLAISQS